VTVKRRNIRIIEVSAGLLLILSVLSFLMAYLLRFEYILPNASIEDDIEFLAENTFSQRLSAFAWLITGVINLFFLPIYLLMFHRYQKGMHILNGLLILVMAFSYFKLGITELAISKITSFSNGEAFSGNSKEATSLLLNVKQILNLTRIGITAFGLFTCVFTISRFKDVKFPVFGSILAFLAGPIVVTFIWLNPDHILMTSSLALSWAGLLIVGVSFVNKGLEENDK
jgi:hypothetical protein